MKFNINLDKCSFDPTTGDLDIQGVSITTEMDDKEFNKRLFKLLPLFKPTIKKLMKGIDIGIEEGLLDSLQDLKNNISTHRN